MTLASMLRVKNEARWIERVLMGLAPVSNFIAVFDDHSTDDTVEVVRRVSRRRLFDTIPIEVFRSPFDDLNEARDKTYLAHKVVGYDSFDWILCLDGDEELPANQVPHLLRALGSTAAPAWRLQIRYLWDRPDQVRVDGCYASFTRQSLFRVSETNLQFRATGYGGQANFHCSNVPADVRERAGYSDAALLHYGYMLREDRIRKYHWYNRIDPSNALEDGYRHMVQGDLAEIPADSKLLHAGPLKLAAI